MKSFPTDVITLDLKSGSLLWGSWTAITKSNKIANLVAKTSRQSVANDSTFDDKFNVCDSIANEISTRIDSMTKRSHKKIYLLAFRQIEFEDDGRNLISQSTMEESVTWKTQKLKSKSNSSTLNLTVHWLVTLMWVVCWTLLTVANRFTLDEYD